VNKNTKALIVVALLMIAVVITLSFACNIKWLKGDGLTLGQKGVLTKTASWAAITELYTEQPGEWKDDVCSVSTIILDALDGKPDAIDTVNTMLAEIGEAPIMLVQADSNQITIELKNALLSLLKYSADRWRLERWDGLIGRAIEIMDVFLVVGITTDYKMWFLTREFFAGIVEGCVQIE